MATTSFMWRLKKEKKSRRLIEGVSLTSGRLMLVLLVLTSASCQLANGLANGLALTPPMGWINWLRFTCETDCVNLPHHCVSEDLFKSMSERIVNDGYLAAGYQYVNIDDCWSLKERASDSSRLVPDPQRFRSGIGALSEFMHERGLKLGLYGDCGERTCGGYPAQLKDAHTPLDNYFQLDAQTFSQWQLDSFKLDGCHIDPIEAQSVCPLFSIALKQTGRPILLTCEWPFYMMYAHVEANFTVASEACNLWRYYDDIEDSWLSIENVVDYTVKHQSTIVKYHGPGHWFDPDQLAVGGFGLSVDQARAQMALWSVWSAPLFMSNDLRDIGQEEAEILKNKHIIEVNQDPLGVWALMVAQEIEPEHGSKFQAFVKPVRPVRNSCPSFVVLYLNRAKLGNRVKMSFKLRDLLKEAPIFQAQLSQQTNEQRTGQANSQSDRIDFELCLERLLKVDDSAQLTSGQPSQSSSTSGSNATQDSSSSSSGSSDNGIAPATSGWLAEMLSSQSASAALDGHSKGATSGLSHFHSAPRYKVFDLFDGGREISNRNLLNLDDPLELVVNLTGVRVVKLIEQD